MKNSALGHRTSKLLLLYIFSISLPETMIYEVDFFKIELPSGPYMLVIKYCNMKEQNKNCLIVKHFFFFFGWSNFKTEQSNGQAQMC